MNFEEFKKKIEIVKSEHPVWFGIDSDEAPSDSDLSEAEHKLGVNLSEDYKDFLFEFGGGYFAFSTVYSLEPGSDWNLIDLNFKYDHIRNGFILISENGSGDFYGFKVINGTCSSQVYFYDHEISTWKETSFNNIFEYLEKYALAG